MSFLKKLGKKAKIKGKVVYDFHAKEVGKISNARCDGEVQVYEVLTNDVNLELSFPADQFFIEDDKICLMPKWLHSLKYFSSKLQESKKKYDKINTLRDAFTEERFFKHLTNITKSGLKNSEEIIKNLPKLEKDSIRLEKERKDVINETSRLMALRMLESRGGMRGSAEKSLTKKNYSLKIIELRRRYEDLSRLIRFMSEVYNNTKDSTSFLNKILAIVIEKTRWVPQEIGVKFKEPHPFLTQDIQDLINKAHMIYNKIKKITETLDTLKTVH